MLDEGQNPGSSASTPKPVQVKKRLIQAWRILGKVWGYLPISLAGLLIVPGAYLVLRYDGLKNLDMVVVSLGAGLVILGLCSIALVALRAAHVYLWLRKHTSSLVLTTETGQHGISEFAIPGAWWLPFVNVSWKWLTPPASVDPVYERGRFKETVFFERRGVHEELVREFMVEDLFRLAKVRFQWSCPAQIKVLPHFGKLLEPPLLIRLSSGDEISDPRGEPVGDRVDMRQYVRGDSPRTILWKVFARTRRLMVRVPERALAARPRVCSYLMCGLGDEPAAALGRVVLEKNLLGQGWRFGSDGQPGYDTQLSDAILRIARSGNREGAPDTSGLVQFLDSARADGYAQCLLLLPPKLPIAREVAQVVAAAGMAVTVCLAVDGVEEPRKTTRLRSWLLFGSSQSRCSAQDLRESAELWGRHPGEVMLVDRAAGVLLGDLRSYQKIRDRREERQSA